MSDTIDYIKTKIRRRSIKSVLSALTLSNTGVSDGPYTGDTPETTVGRLSSGTDISGLTANEILELILVGTWILSNGSWNDSGYWIDTKAWID